MKEEKKYGYLWFDAMEIQNDKMWVFVNGYNALFEINLVSYEVRYLGSVPGEDIAGQSLYFNMIKKNDCLFLIPAYAKYIAVYNIEKQIFSTCECNLPKAQFFGACMLDDKIIMLGNKTANIGIYDIQENRIQIRTECKDYFNSFDLLDRNMYFRKGICALNGNVLFASCISNTIVKYDIYEDQFEFYTIDGGFSGFSNLIFDGEHIWASEWRKPHVAVLDLSLNVERILDFPMSGDCYEISDLVLFKDEVWVFPLVGEKVYSVNKSDYTVKNRQEYDAFLQQKNNHPWKQEFVVTKAFGDMMYSFLGNDMSLLIYDSQNGEINHKYVNVDLRTEMNIFAHNGGLLSETNYPLELFIKNCADA